MRFARARRRPWLPEHVWIVNEDQAAAMGDPLARIAARHSPIAGDDAGDLADGLTFMAAAGGYAVANLQEEAIAASEPRPPEDMTNDA